MRRFLMVALFASLGLSGCKGVADAAAGGSGAQGADGTGFGGAWGGTYHDKSADATSNLHETPAKAAFNATDASTGTFRIDLPQLDNVFVEGSYQTFSTGNSLMLAITNSTLSSIGLSNSQPEVDFKLTGNELTLTRDDIELHLLRNKDVSTGTGTGSAPGTDPTPDPTKQNPILGNYSCGDAEGRTWALHLKTTTSFAAEISEPNRVTLWYDGELALRAKDDPTYTANLLVKKSNQSKAVGTQMRVKAFTDSSLTLYLIGANETDVLEPISCDRLN